MSVTHQPKAGATLTGAEYEAADHHVIALTEAEIPVEIARTADVTTAIAAVIDAAPGALDTLNELAAALGDDANFASTVTTSLAGKQPLDSDLTAIAALTTTAFGRGLLELANAAALLSAAGGAAASHAHAGEDITSGTVADGRVASTLARDSEVTSAVSTHEAASDPHTGYRLESADHSHQSTGLQAGTLDHGLALTGLTDDDHTIYLKEEASGGTAAEVPDHTHVSGAQAGAIKLDDLVAPDDNTDLNASTSAHGLMQKYPGGTTTFLRGDGSFATPTASVTFTAFTKDLGVGDQAGTFDITGLSGLSAGKPVMVMQTAAAISSKGDARDEPEMDAISVTGYVVDATTIRCYWNAPSIVVGDYAFAYLVGA